MPPPPPVGSGKPSAGPASGFPPPPDRGRGASSSGQPPAVKREFTPVKANPHAFRLDELRQMHKGWYADLVKRLVEYKADWCAAALVEGIEPAETVNYPIERLVRFAHESEFEDFPCPLDLCKRVWDKVTPQW